MLSDDLNDEDRQKPIEENGKGADDPPPPKPKRLSRARRRTRDQKWCLETIDVRKRYSNQVVAVCDCKVWGSGDTVDAAFATAAAQKDCPPPKDLVVVVLPEFEQPWIPMLFFSDIKHLLPPDFLDPKTDA